jgi:hypothetical protein
LEGGGKRRRSGGGGGDRAHNNTQTPFPFSPQQPSSVGEFEQQVADGVAALDAALAPFAGGATHVSLLAAN